MEDESRHIKYLIVIAAVLCAVIIGYNAFYVPDTDMTALTVSVPARSSDVPVNSGGISEPDKGESGEYVPLPANREESAKGSDSASQARSKPSDPSGTLTPPGSGGKIDLNTATAEQLETLDGIGEELAKRIVEYRNGHGKFKSVEELKNVSGIGDKKLEAIRNSVTAD